MRTKSYRYADDPTEERIDMAQPQPRPRGIDHVGMSVDDIDTATEFLRKAFDAKVCYDTQTRDMPPRQGPETERQLGMPPGSKITRQRLVQIGAGPSIELFETSGADHQRAALLTDYGLNHLALYVDDIEASARRLADAGAQMLSEVHGNSPHEQTPGNGSVYCRAPWGTLIELQTYPGGIDYPADSETARWTPPPVHADEDHRDANANRGPTGQGTQGDASRLADQGGELVVPEIVQVDGGLSQERAVQIIRTAQLLYTFWNTGRQSYLDQALSPSFRDNMLPPGRPQGPQGPRAGSSGLRDAMPDLTLDLHAIYVTGNLFTARVTYHGHFTGTYNGVQGRGQAVTFDALDVQQLGDDGKITQEWHVEDNLGFLQQTGLATIAQG
ncbi:ester cyclase [Micromonospora chalcea]|jgi:catechol 2,3-dioxygenase-like lactoylglutathione lyase family enzyme/predicted ester cyclase|uniref:ester cyclase n=2 Tax=Micromonosporaceae TaxID=28056 RepID=UPI0013155EBE|nr:ester cyclase [Micromonospora chalcea]